MSDQSTLLLEHHLKELKLPTFLREYGKLAAQWPPKASATPTTCSASPTELTDRHQRMVQRRIRAASPPPRDWTPLTSPPGEPATGHATGPVRVRRAS